MLHFLPDQNQKLITIKKEKMWEKLKWRRKKKKIISLVHLILFKYIKQEEYFKLTHFQGS